MFDLLLEMRKRGVFSDLDFDTVEWKIIKQEDERKEDVMNANDNKVLKEIIDRTNGTNSRKLVVMVV